MCEKKFQIENLVLVKIGGMHTDGFRCLPFRGLNGALDNIKRDWSLSLWRSFKFCTFSSGNLVSS